MRLLRWALLAAAVAAPLAMAGSGPASAASGCSCLSITSLGFCTRYACGGPHLQSVKPENFKNARSVKDCRRSQMLLCDGNECKAVCEVKKKKK